MSINSNTRVTLTIGGIIAAVIALVGTGWRAGVLMADIKAEITELRRDVRALNSSSWTLSDMERWSYRLDVANRERGLIVPDARAAKVDRGQ